jgi:CheY-like chemotaxis protein
VPSVLLIDGDDQFRPSGRLALERRGHRVREAGDGAEGLRAYREAGADVVPLDVFMPGQDGLETLRQLRRLDPAARVVVMSAGGPGPSGDFAPAALALGAAAALRKPFGMPELLAAVAQALAGGSAAGAAPGSARGATAPPLHPPPG